MNSQNNTNTRITKSGQVKEYLLKEGRIDSWTAIKLFKATRLSAIIFNLRRRGFTIDSQPMSLKDSNGNICNFVNYALINTGNKI